MWRETGGEEMWREIGGEEMWRERDGEEMWREIGGEEEMQREREIDEEDRGDEDKNIYIHTYKKQLSKNIQIINITWKTEKKNK